MTTRERMQTALLILLAVLAAAHLMAAFSPPASAYDAKVGSDSATVSVATSGDGGHVYVCDGKRCYASHDGGATFTKMKVD